MLHLDHFYTGVESHHRQQLVISYIQYTNKWLNLAPFKFREEKMSPRKITELDKAQ